MSMIVEPPSNHAKTFKTLLQWPLQLPRFFSVSIFYMIYDLLPLYIIQHLRERFWVLTICFQCIYFSIAPSCPQGQTLQTFCWTLDSCKAFTCIDPHKVKVCIKNDLGKKNDEEAPESSMLRSPSHLLPDSVELCLPSVLAEVLLSFGYADCGSCEPV